MTKIVAEIVLQADPGRSASLDDWKAVVGAICNAVRIEIANAKTKAYTEAISNRKDSTDFQPSAPSSAASGREPTA